MSVKVQIIAKIYFMDQADYDVQQAHALTKFSSANGACLQLSELEQELVHEFINISKYYPRLDGIITVCPFKC